MSEMGGEQAAVYACTYRQPAPQQPPAVLAAAVFATRIAGYPDWWFTPGANREQRAAWRAWRSSWAASADVGDGLLLAGLNRFRPDPLVPPARAGVSWDRPAAAVWAAALAAAATSTAPAALLRLAHQSWSRDVPTAVLASRLPSAERVRADEGMGLEVQLDGDFAPVRSLQVGAEGVLAFTDEGAMGCGPVTSQVLAGLLEHGPDSARVSAHPWSSSPALTGLLYVVASAASWGASTHLHREPAPH